ncbi:MULTISPECIES: energy transducer TonB [unclassified Beijerinckia]|uniref:energy transducer TonB n=1 Tax=unclassified Beijerinckia TaxID=2638183 RepID=UPI000899C8D7|nr:MULTISPECIES: energy transducer TonB [unclassified Beijerinckia]MDH7798765.1 protein TonB [Beijerinckia sp. GAS462]SED32399.1 TonB family C-terminal domain-containing protein [Beijerinckia sp. 28-YEA-48]
MTVLATELGLTEGRNLPDSGQRNCLTGLAFVVAFAAHGAVIAGLANYAPEVSLPPIAIDLVPPADITANLAPAQEQQQAQEASQEAAQETPQETPAEPPQEAKTEPTETPPPEPEQQTAALPEPPTPVMPPAPEPAITAPPVVRETPKPPPKPQAAKPVAKPKPEPKVAAKPKEHPKAEPPAAARSAARPSPAAGVATANRAAQSGMSSAAYASLVAAALNRLKVYPAAARQSGAAGSVGVSFTIGAGGRVTSSSIRSSGNGLLDAAVRQMLASLQVPPPPGGTFRTGTTISFSLR